MNSNAPTVPSPPDKLGNGQAEKHENSEQEQLIEQYKTYLDTIDHFAEKRLHLHEFFMAINSFLGTLFGYVVTSEKSNVLLLLPLAIMGFSFSRVWYLLVTNFTTVNSAKWKVIYDMEKKLPYQPFLSEWKGNLEDIKSDTPNFFSWPWMPRVKAFYSTSCIDSELPQLFGMIYIVLGIGSIVVWAYKSEWLHSKISDIGFFFNATWQLGLAWVGIVILLPVLVIIALWLLSRRK